MTDTQRKINITQVRTCTLMYMLYNAFLLLLLHSLDINVRTR